MKIYVFGNPDVAKDSYVYEYIEKLVEDFPGLEFFFVKPNEDLPFVKEKNVIILDTVEGINEPRLISDKDLEKIKTSPRTTVHDFDLGFQLKYLKKLGKLEKVTIIGIPMTGKTDYSSIHSMVKKLVAQDIQGS